MKKEYSKPGIIIENFELVQNIAAGCGAAHESDWGSPTHWSKATCGWEIIEGVIAWTKDSGVCNDFYGENEGIGGICYNHPEGGATIFSS